MTNSEHRQSIELPVERFRFHGLRKSNWKLRVKASYQQDPEIPKPRVATFRVVEPLNVIEHIRLGVFLVR